MNGSSSLAHGAASLASILGAGASAGAALSLGLGWKWAQGEGVGGFGCLATPLVLPLPLCKAWLHLGSPEQHPCFLPVSWKGCPGKDTRALPKTLPPASGKAALPGACCHLMPPSKARCCPWVVLMTDRHRAVMPAEMSCQTPTHPAPVLPWPCTATVTLLPPGLVNLALRWDPTARRVPSPWLVIDSISC